MIVKVMETVDPEGGTRFKKKTVEERMKPQQVALVQSKR